MDDNNFNTLCRQLAGQIKAARQQAKLSQEMLALAAEVDRTYVSQLERGIANPSLLILYRLAKTLGLELQIAFVSATEGNRPRRTDQEL